MSAEESDLHVSVQKACEIKVRQVPHEFLATIKYRITIIGTIPGMSACTHFPRPRLSAIIMHRERLLPGYTHHTAEIKATRPSQQLNIIFVIAIRCEETFQSLKRFKKWESKDIGQFLTEDHFHCATTNGTETEVTTVVRCRHF